MGLKLGVMKNKEDKKNYERDGECDIPHDLMREILLRLPAKSLLRFRCVSKLWFSTTTDPSFINSFATQSSTRPYLELCFTKEDNWLFFSLAQKSLSHHHMDHITLPKEDRFINDFESILGLISFQYLNYFVIWNPTIRQHVTIPKPKDSWHTRSYLGYDPIGDTYKLLCMSNTSDSRPQVLTLGAQESWRLIKNSPMHYKTNNGKYINGFIFYEAYLRYEYYGTLVDRGCPLYIYREGLDRKTIMRFDVRSEEFKPIQMPPHFSHKTRHALVNYEGKVARICQESSFIILWILEDVDKEKWSYKEFHVPFPPEDPIEACDYSINILSQQNENYILNGIDDDTGELVKYILSGINDDTGEFIFIPLTMWCGDKEAYVFCYDPKKKCTRKIRFEGTGNGIRREVQTMSLINHPNLLQAHCSFTAGHQLWVVMPYIAGGSCLHIIKSSYQDGFEEPVIATLLRETLKALLMRMHYQYIWLPVLAGNILLDFNGAVKLADFGVSACMFDTGDRQRSRNTFVGTPCWMAPEVMQQLHGYDFKADVWSFGITALELAHGHAPFSKYPPMKVKL
ncbi:unnamed protein product [Brassica oleracea]|uniref:(rape) hypothetical protein n=1 Tax=Brassica napus TaxID=3708 RepID=A0A816I6S0_BRANA|nr:unnamed protein product [Brassica napus]